MLELLGIYPAKAVEEPEAEDSVTWRVLLNQFDFPYKGPAYEEQEGTVKDEGAKGAALVAAGAREESVD